MYHSTSSWSGEVVQECPSEFSTHSVRTIYSEGSLHRLVQGDIAADSGPYTYGFATLSARVKRK